MRQLELGVARRNDVTEGSLEERAHLAPIRDLDDLGCRVFDHGDEPA